MSDDTDDIAAFLNARLDEREAAAQAAAKYPGRDWITLAGRDNREATVMQDGGNPIAWIDDGDAMAVATHMASHDPRRILREVEAERAIVTRCTAVLTSFDDRENGLWPDVSRRERSHARSTLRDLAAVYSDHADCQPEWAS